MPKIIPIKELKNTSAISEMCHESNEPVFVTKNGYGDMVFMSMETYEAREKKYQIYHDIEVSEQQIAQGQVKDAKMALSEMRSKYGL
ncbi:MAG: type II toxin-antitoxin system Phd/YefM family antitoxin [Eubacteriales bacterium]|nr:type II toxin-antitoxin system Phd/YefM family antitoxin [Eubacteriales bacterium]